MFLWLTLFLLFVFNYIETDGNTTGIAMLY